MSSRINQIGRSPLSTSILSGRGEISSLRASQELDPSTSGGRPSWEPGVLHIREELSTAYPHSFPEHKPRSYRESEDLSTAFDHSTTTESGESLIKKRGEENQEPLPVESGLDGGPGPRSGFSFPLGEGSDILGDMMTLSDWRSWRTSKRLLVDGPMIGDEGLSRCDYPIEVPRDGVLEFSVPCRDDCWMIRSGLTEKRGGCPWKRREPKRERRGERGDRSP